MDVVNDEIKDLMWFNDVKRLKNPIEWLKTNYIFMAYGDLVKTIINHPPVITIFIGGMVTIPTGVVNIQNKNIKTMEHHHF